MKTTAERLNCLSEALGISLRQMSQEIGRDETMLNQAKKSKYGLGSEHIMAIARKYPDANIMFLVTGEGEPLLSMEETATCVSAKKIISELDKMCEAAQKLKSKLEPLTDMKTIVKK